MRTRGPGSIVRLVVPFVLGCAAAISAFVLGMPGNGEFVPAIWLAGFAAQLIAPGWAGLVALLVGGTLAAALLDLTDGTFGLVALIVAVESALAAHGALVASILRRLRRLGWGRGARDRQVLAGGALAVSVVLFGLWFAGELARNPP